MMKFLVHITLGNIQGFIGSARRTRDLWFGSFVLSELSKSAALFLQDQQPNCLVFPSERPGGLPLTDPSFSAANVVAVLECADRDACIKLLQEAKQAVLARWKEFAAEARTKVDAASTPRQRKTGKGVASVEFLRDDVWNSQLDDVVDYICAAVPIGGEGHQDYAAASANLDRLLAARKQTHVFAQYSERTSPRLPLPKSSLDGAQSTVIQEPRSGKAAMAAATRRRLGIENAEQLDTGGMVKRVVGRSRAFVPVARVATELWLAQLESADSEGFKSLVDAYRSACDGVDADFLGSELGEAALARFPWLRKFPFDAQLLYPPRIDAALAAAAFAQEQDGAAVAEEIRSAAETLRKALTPLWQKFGPPQPYYAMVYADGDRMGGLVRASATGGASGQRAVSQALAAFAESVPSILNDFAGASIYAGGDDVLALVGLDRAIECAYALQKNFKDALQKVANDNHVVGTQQPTLRVGVVVAHYLTPLSDVRAAAERAGTVAKMGVDSMAPLATDQRGNALAILVLPRSGVDLSVRLPWDDADALTRLKGWSGQLSDGDLPGGLPNEIDLLYKSCGKQDSVELFRVMLAALLAKKRRADGKSLNRDVVNRVLTEICGASVEQAHSWPTVGARCKELLAARWFAAHDGSELEGRTDG